jgi:hypothetical protein
MTSGSDGSSQTRTFSSVTSKRGGRVRLSRSAVYSGVKKWDSRSIFGILATVGSLLASFGMVN